MAFTRRLRKMSKELDEILETILREHEDAQQVGQHKGHKDFVEILLSCMDTNDEPHNFVIDRTNMKAILLDMLGGSLDTSAAVVLWAFPELEESKGNEETPTRTRKPSGHEQNG